MKSTVIIILLSMGLFVSCNQNKPKDQEKKDKINIENSENSTKIAVEKVTFNSTFNVNNGKWTANPETFEGIEKMRELIESFTDKDDIKAYKKLKGALEVVFMDILTNCTMEGEAHNRLHAYLIPIRDTFEGLGKDDLNLCKKSFNALNKHLDEYENYFE